MLTFSECKDKIDTFLPFKYKDASRKLASLKLFSGLVRVSFRKKKMVLTYFEENNTRRITLIKNYGVIKY